MDLEKLKSRSPLVLVLGGLMIVAACTFAWISPPGTEAAQGNWGGFSNLTSDNADGSSDPAIAVNGDGKVAAAWVQSMPAGQSVWAWIPSRAGEDEDVFQVAPAEAEAGKPRVVVTPAGSVVITWIESTEGGSAVRAWANGDFRDLSLPVDNASDLSLATNSDGTVSASWVESSGGQNSVMAAVKVEGASFAHSETVSTPVPSSRPAPSVAVNPDGDTVVAWTDLIGGHQVIRIALRVRDGAFGPPELVPPTVGEVDDPRIAIDSANRLMLVWRALSGGIESNWGLRDRELASYPVDLTYAAAPSSHPQVTLNSHNEAIAVWTEVVGEKSAIFAQTFELETGISRTPERLSATGTSASDPRVASGLDGTTTVVWRQGGTAPVIQSATREVGGAFDARGRVSSTGIPDDQPDVAVDATGRAHAIWRSEAFIRTASTEPPPEPVLPDPDPDPDPDVDPPACRPTLRLGMLQRAPATGTAKLTVRVSGPGTLTLQGRRIRKVMRTPRQAGTFNLMIRPKSGAAKQLKQRGRLRVKAKVTYRPTGRCSTGKRSASKTVKLVKRKRR